MDLVAFTFTNNKGNPISIYIENEHIRIVKQDNTKEIGFKDIIGVWIPPIKPQPPFQGELIYTKTKEINYKKFNIETIKEKYFVSLDLFAAEYKELFEFRQKVLHWFYTKDINKFALKAIPDNQNAYYKRALVIVNPNAGSKKGLQIFNNCQKIFFANGIYVDHVMCKPNRYTENFIKEMPREQLTSYDVIICISGDGIPHEVINGYMERNDIDFNKNPITLGLLPAGSGCALSENCLKLNGHQNIFSNSMYSICHFSRHPMNLQMYDCLKQDGTITRIWGFLNCLYGFFADVDIESEFLRKLGHLRFDIYGTWKYLVCKKYKVMVEMPKNETIAFPAPNQLIGDSESIEKYQGDVYSFYSSALPFMSKNYLSSPVIKDNRGQFDVQIFPVSVGKGKLLKYLLGHPEHKIPNDHGIIERQVKQYRLTLSPDDKNPNIDIDGETYRHLKIKTVQATISDYIFYTLS